MNPVIVIGNGISGITAARHIRKHSDKRILVISGETDYFFSRTALMYVYMGHMKFEQTEPYEAGFWKKNRIELFRGHVNTVDTVKKSVQVDGVHDFHYDQLIIASGSKPNKFGWPGQDLHGVQGLYSKQDLDLLESNAPNREACRRAVIVGGGLIGIELAEMLRSRDIPVTFLVRESSFWNGVLPDGESAMLNEHIRSHHIDLRLSTNLKEIKAGPDGRVSSVVIEGSEEEIHCDLVGLTAGVSPNIKFLRGSGIETDKGILVDRELRTSAKDVFAIGDCAQQREAIGNRRPVEAVWYTGRMMGEAVAQTICGNPTPYRPGHWFNSAKFLDIEYQTYGWVFSQRSRKPYEEQFHWRHPKEWLSITVSFHKETQKFLGINAFGIRMRHEVFDRWLSQEKTVDEVMTSLRTANFDPEFYRKYEGEILVAYNQEYGKSLKPARRNRKEVFGLIRP